jgi:hypothetical protein
MIESDLISNENITSRRHVIQNFFESYYYQKENVNNILKNIKKSNTKSNTNNVIELVESIDDVNVDLSLLSSPSKDIYQFFHFCKIYTEDSLNDECNKRKKQIDEMLHTMSGIEIFENTINTIVNIQNKYKY